jgi:shikimate 5-dehydrogenase
VNEANQITNATKLFGFIAEDAQQNRFAVTLNKRFKSAGDDAMMIPMNIRPDDFYFTLSNMKQSHVNGAVIGFEYQAQALEVVDSASGLCERCGICDTVTVSGGRMYGELLLPAALKTMAQNCDASKIAVIGATPLAGAMAEVLEEMQVSFFDPWIEELMTLQARLGIDLDINRLAEGMEADLSSFDMVIDLSEMSDLSMVSALPSLNVDLKPPRHPSALRQRCTELDRAYSGYESLLDIMTDTVYTYLTKEKK